MNACQPASTPLNTHAHTPLQPFSIPVDKHAHEPTPHLESFPQPAFSTQEALQQRLQQHPYRTDNYRQQQSTIDLLACRASENMASVPKHLNFITGNKNKLAEVRTHRILRPCNVTSCSVCSENVGAAENMRGTWGV